MAYSVLLRIFRVVLILSITTVSARPGIIGDSLGLLQGTIKDIHTNVAGHLTGLTQGPISFIPNVHGQVHIGQGINAQGGLMLFNGIPQKGSNNNNFQNQPTHNENVPSPQWNGHYGPSHNQFKPPSDYAQSSASATASASSSNYGGNHNNYNHNQPTGNLYTSNNHDSDTYTTHNNHNQYDGSRPNFNRYPNQGGNSQNNNYEGSNQNNQFNLNMPNFNGNPNQDGNSQNNNYGASNQNNQFNLNRPNSDGNPNQDGNSQNDNYEGGNQNNKFNTNRPNSDRLPNQNLSPQSSNSGYSNIDHNVKPVVETIIDDISPPFNANKSTSNDEKVVMKTDGKVTSDGNGGDEEIYSIDIRNGDGGNTN